MGTILPNCLEGDHATSDPVWADFHYVHLACNPKILMIEREGRYPGVAHWRTPIPAPLQSFAIAYSELRPSTSDRVLYILAMDFAYPHTWSFGRVKEDTALKR